MHENDAQELMSTLSTLSNHPAFIRALHEEGRNRAGRWLAETYRSIGTRSSFDLAPFLA
jgi:NTE family protein